MNVYSKNQRQQQIYYAAAAALTCAALALALYYKLSKARGAVAELYHKNSLVKRIDLMSAEESEFSIPQLPNVVFRVTGDGGIAFERADCPDQLCVQSGRLSRRGQIAACLSNDVYIRLVSPSDLSEEETGVVLDEEAGPLEDAGYSYEI
jgi:hypothetical protein